MDDFKNFQQNGLCDIRDVINTYKVIRIHKYYDTCRLVEDNLTKDDADKLSLKLNNEEPDPMSVYYHARKM